MHRRVGRQRHVQHHRAGKDAAQGKLTYPALLGAPEARKRVEELLKKAVENADMIGGPVNYLAPIARYICDRRS